MQPPTASYAASSERPTIQLVFSPIMTGTRRFWSKPLTSMRWECSVAMLFSKLAAMTNAKVVGVDPSSASIGVASKLNKHLINSNRVEIRQVSVSDLPFAEATFDLITAVEAHFWWPDLPTDVGRVARVLKPGGTFLIIAEVYRGSYSSECTND